MKIKYFAFLLALLLLTGCTPQTPEASSQIFAMDTVMDFYAVGEGAEDALTAAAQEINRLESLLSRTRAGSDVSALNETGSANLSDETVQLLRDALHYAEVTGGAFDVTIAPLVEAWNIHGENPRVLTADEIAALLPLVGSHHLQLSGNTAALDEGCAIDLGGIAKGYASDVIARLYRDRGMTGGWISLGGNVYAHGTKPDGSLWNVAIRDPQDTTGSAAMVQLSNQFAVTSGGYQRYFTGSDGTVYQHILDPKTGIPAMSDLLSVTIVNKNGAMADAYSTALYVMGESGAVDFWREHSTEFDMILITADGRLLYTEGLDGRVTTEKGGAYAVQVLS